MHSSTRFQLYLAIISSAFVIGLTPNLNAASERVYLKKGDPLVGVNRGFTEQGILWEQPNGKTIEILLEDIDRIEYPGIPIPRFDDSAADDFNEGILEPLTGSGEGAISEVTAPTTNTLKNIFHATVSGFEAWTKRIEIGGRFLDGNSDEDFITAGGKFERIHGNSVGQIDFGGQYGRSDGDITSNRWNANLTYDYGKSGNWIVFATAKNEYDEFENLDYRGTYSSGIGYRFYNDDDRRLIIRVGPAVTYELFRDPKLTRTTPDGFGEIEINWPLWMQSSFESKTTVHPSLEDISVVRLVSNSGLLVKLNDDGRWKLRLGFRVEYNSAPNKGRLPADYTSSIRIVYTRK